MRVDPLLDGYIDEYLRGDVFLLAPDAVGNSFHCDEGTPTSNPAPDVSGVVGALDGTTATVIVTMIQSPAISSRWFSWAVKLRTVTAGNTQRTFQWEIQDGVESVGELDDQGHVDPAGVEMTLLEGAVVFSFESELSDPLAVVFAESFSTAARGEPAACDRVTAPSLDFPIPATETTGTCTPNEGFICLNNDRFGTQMFDPNGSPAYAGTGLDDTEEFATINGQGWIRVLNGCPINDHFWVIAATNSAVAIDINVTDTAASGGPTLELYVSRDEPLTDTTAFATCP